MGAKTILTFALFLAVRTASPEVPQPPSQSQCKFSDGSTIKVTYFSEQAGTTQLVTDESLVTVKGISVPAGDYIVSPARDSHNNWTLTMRRKTGKNGSSQLPPIPMSATTAALPIENIKVSFDQTGGSCMMHWGMEKSNVVLSLEFTQRNTDMPVLQ